MNFQSNFYSNLAKSEFERLLGESLEVEDKDNIFSVFSLVEEQC